MTENVTEEQDEVREAIVRFYDAIEDLIAGRGAESMERAWHHTASVTSAHPSGEWSVGWEEIFAVWEFFSTFGRTDRAGTRAEITGIHQVGPVAYATVNFISSPAFGGELINCTTILRELDGEWRVIHHHPDKSPKMALAMNQMLEED